MKNRVSVVYSLNIAGYAGSDPDVDTRKKRLSTILDRVQKCCEQGTVVCLQEVHRDWIECFTETFEKMGYKIFSCLSNKRIDVYLITAVPQGIEAEEMPIEIPDGSDQFALAIKIGDFILINCHFAVTLKFRMEHTNAIIRFVSKRPENCLIIGDMNLMGDWGGPDQIKLFEDAGGVDLTREHHIPDGTMRWFQPYLTDPVLKKPNYAEIIQKSIMLCGAILFRCANKVQVVAEFLPNRASDHPGIEIRTTEF